VWIEETRNVAILGRSRQTWNVMYPQQWEDPSITHVNNQARLNFVTNIILASRKCG